ncbi:MAG TPA: alpha-amylase/4-alpha-glucanotransferase domain-containing protein [Candidatus Limnocylindrales bacterium]|nr:alpha-amylase/4-alpha-glucanotransferase domain-containing protein [Candidatus Limnocylindrales bacterium]
MAPRVSLALVLHNHQPVGNFGWVIGDAYDHAYEPLIGALERHGSIRMALHYSGPLLDWLAANRPEFVERVGRLVRDGRVELLGGGYYEPILAALPVRDRLAQLVRMGEAIERIGGRRPRGAWLAERVWEPDVPVSLVDAGYDWTVLDDAHLRAGSVDESQLWGSFSTDDQGRRLAIFPSAKTLRYLMPFGDVEASIAELRAHAIEGGGLLGTMGDDGEKFGAWPQTFAHCWAPGHWMDRFFDALAANADWLELVTPSEWLDRERPIGRVYIPTSSYAEMGEWALPAGEGLEFERALDRAEREHSPEVRWLRGGFWRNFQVKYREINELHKQMLRVSAKVDGLATRAPDAARLEPARVELYQGQSNDCYWHGVFGGIYITHMRLATLEHLIAAEDLVDSLDRASGRPVDAIVPADTDLDGAAEILVTSPGQVVVIDPAHGGGIGSWDIRAVRHALASVLRRRPEAYHAQLLEADAGPAARAGAEAGGHAGDSAPSIHGVVRAREAGLAGRLHYDGYERRLGLVHLFAPGTSAVEFEDARATELSDALDGAYAVAETGPEGVVLRRTASFDGLDGSLRIEKRFTFGGDRRAPAIQLDVELANAGSTEVAAELALEWPVMLLGGGANPAAWYELDGRRSPHDGRAEHPAIERVSSGNDYIGLRLETTLGPAGTAWWSPIETISNSEFGFERTYQGSAFVAVWPIRLAPGERITVHLGQQVVCARDRLLAD